MYFMISLLQPVIRVVIHSLRTALVGLLMFTLLSAVGLGFYKYLAETSVASGKIVACLKQIVNI